MGDTLTVSTRKFGLEQIHVLSVVMTSDIPHCENDHIKIARSYCDMDKKTFSLIRNCFSTCLTLSLVTFFFSIDLKVLKNS